MTTFEKHYIGKGTQVPNLSIVKVVIPVENIQDAIFEKDGKEYLSFEIAKLKNADKFGRDYTCYYQQKVYSEDATSNEPEKQKKAQKPAGKKNLEKRFRRSSLLIKQKESKGSFLCRITSVNSKPPKLNSATTKVRIQKNQSAVAAPS